MSKKRIIGENMTTKIEKEQVSYVPTDTSLLYPAEDGQPMAVSDLHREQMVWTIDILKTHYSQDPSVYVSGDILMYYVQGEPSKSISPDVLVTFGIGMKPRRTYLVWEEGKVPDFVMEFSSESTYRNDLTDKMDIYASLGIKEYFLYDAEDLYLPSQLMGFELVNGVYIEVQPDDNSGIRSSSLSLDFCIRDESIAIYDPIANDWVRTLAETEAIRADTAEARADTAKARADTAEARADAAETRAAQEVNVRKKVEAEIAQLREQIARLQARS